MREANTNARNESRLGPKRASVSKSRIELRQVRDRLAVPMPATRGLLRYLRRRQVR